MEITSSSLPGYSMSDGVVVSVGGGCFNFLTVKEGGDFFFYLGMVEVMISWWISVVTGDRYFLDSISGMVYL